MLGVLAKITAKCKRMDSDPTLSIPSSWTALSFWPQGTAKRRQETPGMKKRKSSER